MHARDWNKIEPASIKKLDAFQTVGSLALGVADIAFRWFAHMDLLNKQARWQSELLTVDPHNDAGFQLALRSLDDMLLAKFHGAGFVRQRCSASIFSIDWSASNRLATIHLILF